MSDQDVKSDDNDLVDQLLNSDDVSSLPTPSPSPGPVVTVDKKVHVGKPKPGIKPPNPVSPKVFYDIAVAKEKADQALTNYRLKPTKSKKNIANNAIKKYNSVARKYEKITGTLPDNNQAPLGVQKLKPVVKPNNSSNQDSNLSEDVTKKTKSYFTVGDFTRTQDTNGNPVFMYNGSGTSKDMPIALLGDANGNPIRTTYGKQFEEAGLDHNSPVTINGAINTVIQQLQSTPDGVRKFKQLAIAKHIIPPSAANRTMASDLADIVDGTTQNAISYLINAVTGHNVTLADMGKPNQKFMSFNNYINNMPALSVSTTETSQVHQQIQPKDYELSIDQMFQNILGRGATADELKHFTNQLQTYSNANPQVSSKTTTETTTGSSASVNVSGGLSENAAGAMMRDEALKNPEAEEFNKGSKFFDWFQEAIGSPVQLGG